MDRQTIINLLGNDWGALQDTISKALQSDIDLLNQVNASILSHGGKMLRPLVSLLFARACSGGEPNADSLLYAASVELLHNATLLHDDVADSSDTRRGKPTTRSILGPQAAVLVGDFWLSKAVDLLMKADSYREVSASFSKTLSDLARGEMLQLQLASSGTTTEEDYYTIIYNKTASLFVTACETGALSVKAPKEWVDAAGEYGKSLGLAFQVKDDILDYCGTEDLGKPVGSDLKEQKITLPLLCAIAGSEQEKEIRAMVSDILNHPDYCSQITKFVAEHEGVQRAAVELHKHVASAIKALGPIPDCPEKDALIAIAHYNVIREK